MDENKESLLQKLLEWHQGQEFIDDEEVSEAYTSFGSGAFIGSAVGYVLGMAIFFPEYFFIM